MKTNVESLVNAIIADNKEIIIENNQTVAEYLLQSIESEDQGYIYYLSDSEIESYYESKQNEYKLQEEVESFINSNFNYHLEED